MRSRGKAVRTLAKKYLEGTVYRPEINESGKKHMMLLEQLSLFSAIRFRWIRRSVVKRSLAFLRHLHHWSFQRSQITKQAYRPLYFEVFQVTRHPIGYIWTCLRWVNCFRHFVMPFANYLICRKSCGVIIRNAIKACMTRNLYCPPEFRTRVFRLHFEWSIFISEWSLALDCNYCTIQVLHAQSKQPNVEFHVSCFGLSPQGQVVFINIDIFFTGSVAHLFSSQDRFLYVRAIILANVNI